METSIHNPIGSLAHPRLFCNLRWLSPTQASNVIPLPSLLKTFQNLPSLQVLHFFRSPMPIWEKAAEDPKSIVTLHELIVLITNCPVIHLINAPKLSHLNALYSYSAGPVRDTYDQLCGFDFSKITRIRSEMIRGSINSSITGNPTHELKDIENISWSNWASLRDYCYKSGLRWILTNSPLHTIRINSTSVLEYIERNSPSLIPKFISYLEKATNLEEIILTGLDLSSLGRVEIDSLSNTLRRATSIRKLTILSSNSLKDLCDFLINGYLLPCLERLSYSASPDEVNIRHSYSSLWDLTRERSMTSIRPLSIELSNFLSLHPRELRRMTNLGLELNQDLNRGKLIMFYSKKGQQDSISNLFKYTVDLLWDVLTREPVNASEAH
ncbi:hypothetical protein Clacol_010471 [Clathrus columnatus]|uniref:Uncharacterized protein n=1 Tax=Clathrus columnatus TaxID=1419009 RepID=A0AAV5AV46_9AGAM|nr:hypothetical protein Clacol_010471 [Clathrus columnatus]